MSTYRGSFATTLGPDDGSWFKSGFRRIVTAIKRLVITISDLVVTITKEVPAGGSAGTYVALMANTEQLPVYTERTFASTTWRWKKVKLPGPSHPQGIASPQATPSRGFRKRDATREVTLRVRYKGGAESSWLVSTPEFRWRFPGHLCLDDVLMVATGQRLPYGS